MSGSTRKLGRQKVVEVRVAVISIHRFWWEVLVYLDLFRAITALN